MNQRLAIVFPGQGSQSQGMFSPWQDHATFRAVIEQASSAADIDLWALAQSGSVQQLGDTRLTQPLMVAAGLATWQAWCDAGGARPALAAGHSVGEITALAVAQVFELPDAIALVRARAGAMAQAVPSGSAGMAAVLGLDDAQVQHLCATCALAEVLEPVNYNAPGQVVVAGHVGAIERLKAAAREAGAKMVFVLPVSGPFHSSLMHPAAQRLAQALAPIRVAEPGFGVLHNADLSRLSALSVKPALVQHLTMPVNWVGTVQAFAAAGITHVLELGPGEVLSNLCKRIAPQLVALAAPSPQALAQAVQAVQAASPPVLPPGSP